jgi:hypothetical protein
MKIQRNTIRRSKHGKPIKALTLKALGRRKTPEPKPRQPKPKPVPVEVLLPSTARIDEIAAERIRVGDVPNPWKPVE